MSRLTEEFNVAHRTGVVISAILAAAAFTVFVVVANDPPTRALRVPLGVLIAAVMFAYGFVVSYVYNDAKRRGMRQGLWTLIALFVPNALGFIAYFLLRHPLLEQCAACGATAKRDFAFCPQCGSPLPRVCPSCRRPVEPIWPHCAHCGQKLHAQPDASTPVPES